MATYTAQDFIRDLKLKLVKWEKDLASTDKVAVVKSEIATYLANKYEGPLYIEQLLKTHIAQTQEKIGTSSR